MIRTVQRLAAAITAFAFLLTVPTAMAQAQLKTAKVCGEEYSAQKQAIRAAKEKKKDFISACRSLPEGTPTPIEAAVTPAAPAPVPTAPAPEQTTVPPQAPAPTKRTQSPAPRPTNTASPSGDSTYSHMPPGAAPDEFATEASAKAHCRDATVVWVNTKSKVYHFAGTHNYGHTKEGAFMCETEAQAAGDRASETEKHP